MQHENRHKNQHNAGVLKEIVEAPARAVEKTIEMSEKSFRALERRGPVRRMERFWHLLGPGLTTGAADDDPSGIATYSQAGSRYGLQLLWLAPLTFPMMAIVQEMCARIGLVTGRGLAANIRRHFPRWVLVLSTLLLLAANTLNIGADLGAMASAGQLLFPQVPFLLLLLFFTVLSLVLQIALPYRVYARYLKWLAFVLVAYILSAMSVTDIPWGDILRRTLVPSIAFSPDQLLLLCGILGTTISPYLFFWQTSQEVEEEILQGKKTVHARQGADGRELRSMRADVWSGMLFSNVVMFFIILTGGLALHANGITEIATAADAAEALRPFAGDAAYLLFAFGILGTGLLAVPVLAGSAAYALSESFGWREGLEWKLRQAQAFYGVIILATFLGLVMNLFGMDAIKALLYAAIGNGIVAPVVLVMIVLLSSSSRVMGRRVNSPAIRALGWGISVLMALVGIGALTALVSGIQ